MFRKESQGEKSMITIPLNKEESKPVERLAVNALQAAEMLGISERTLWKWTKEKKVPSVKIGRRVLYPVEGLRKLINGLLENEQC